MIVKLIAVFIALQPFFWWVIFSLLYPVAKRIGSLDGLATACILTPIVIIIMASTYIIHKDIENTK